MKKVVYILGAGRSGSTVLDRVLGSHPNMISTGELEQLIKYLPLQPKRGMCSCGRHLIDCSLYGSIPILRDNSYDPINVKRKIFDYIFEYKQKLHAVVESSKSPQRLDEIITLKGSKYNIKIIFLTRDVKGVSYSVSRKGKNVDGKRRTILRSTLSWYVRNRQSLKVLRKVAPDSKLHITYESFVSDPVSCVKEICSFIGVEFSPLMLDYGKREQHIVDGNYLARNSEDSIIKMDLQYIGKLRPWELVFITLVAGRLNYTLMNKLVDI